jgi:HEPN domain-containing protein
MKEFQKWLEKAKQDFDVAKYLFKGKKYEEASFFCQQAVEKALKSLSLKTREEIRKSHDLIVLGNDVKLPENLLEKCKDLSNVYIVSRYPDVGEMDDDK